MNERAKVVLWHEPNCDFAQPCFAKSHDKCTILNAMPKPRKDGSCPFCKETNECAEPRKNRRHIV